MGPIEFRPDTASIVIKDNLGTSVVDDHALSSELAITFVEGNVTDMRNCPAVCRGQFSVVIQEFIDACLRRTQGIKVNANPVLISYHSTESAVRRQRQAKRKGQV